MVDVRYRIRCMDVSKWFRTTRVLESINWTIEPGALIALIGASGVGKTTLLRVIAGTESCSSGRVVIERDGSQPVGRRPSVGMVFQNLALWPHLTARRHVEYVLGSLPRRQRRERAAAVLTETRLPENAWDRYPAGLSGGEAQRLALARALAPRPGILLLDEPLAQVDAALRGELLGLIAELIAARGITALFVTHHAAEAMELGHRVAVMRQGRIAMDGVPDEVFWQASTLDIAQLTGPLVRLPLSSLAEGAVGVEAGISNETKARWKDAAAVYFRPQQLRLTTPRGRNRWTPTDCRPNGSGWRVTLTQGPLQVVMDLHEPLPAGNPVGIEVRHSPA